MLSLNRQNGFALGIDLDHKNITYILSDLLGYPVHTEIIPLETSNYETVVELLATQIIKFQAQCSDSRYGLIGAVIGVHGTVGKNEKAFFVPQHQWRDKDLKVDLEKETGVSVLIENNANASAFAEKVFKSQDSENLLSISMYSGMGLGIIMEGELLKGYNGFAGEMGHMIVVPDGKLCTCGNKGCWEMYASEARFLQDLATLKNKSNLSYEDVESWLAAKDPVIIRKIDEFFEFLAIGLNNIINLYNPETIVLNSQVLKMYPGAIDCIKSLLKSSVSQYRELKLSDLGKDACAMGACALAIKSFLKVPELRLDLSKNHLPADDCAGTII